MIRDNVKEIIACPNCKKDLVLNKNNKLKCKNCKKEFEINGNSPILI